MPPSSASTLIEALSPADRAVAELMALIGEQLTRKALLDIVVALNAPTFDGKAWSIERLNDSLNRLKRKRVLARTDEVADAWREPLIRDVALRENGAGLARRLLKLTAKSWRETGPPRTWAIDRVVNDAALVRAVRLNALAGEKAETERLIRLAEESAQREAFEPDLVALLLRDVPADAPFIARLSPELRDRVLAAHVERLIDLGELAAASQTHVDALADREAGPDSDADWAPAPRLDRALLRLDLLAERPACARARIRRVRRFDLPTALAAEATLAFLETPETPSEPLFREALKQLRKAVNRRKITLSHEFGLQHLMALFAAADGGPAGDIVALLAIVKETDPHVATVLTGLLDVTQGRDDLARGRMQAYRAGYYRQYLFEHLVESPMRRAVLTLALAVIDPELGALREPYDREAVARWGRFAPSPARVLAQVHARAADAPAVWRETLARLGGGYPRQYLDIVPLRPSWDRALDRLQRLLAPPTRAEPAAQPEKSRRLAFRLDSATGIVGAVEQAARRGVWSAGRPVSLKRLYDSDPKLDYLTAEDEAPLSTLVQDDSYYTKDYMFDPVRAPLALIGHPRVFDDDAPERRVELVAYPVELVVREDGDSIRIGLSHMADRPRVFVEPETPTRWRVLELTAEMVTLANALGFDGLTAPRSARERVIALIRTENARLPIRSELAGAGNAVAIGDLRPILQIVREGDGLHLRAVVRPLGDGGVAYAPGIGVDTVLTTEGGAYRRVRRDLKAEAAALEAVAAACPSLAAWREGDHAWRIGALEDALEALQQLHAFDGSLGLEWPQGAAIRPTRDVGANAVSLTIASAREWFDVKGQIRVDEDLVLEMAEVLARLESTPGRFIALDDGRYLALTEDLRRRLDGFAAVTEDAKGGRRIGAAGAGAVEELVDAAGTVEADPRWTELVARMAAAQGYDPAPPTGLEAELRDYQLQGYKWLSRLSRLQLGACLADDMGLGKTVQTLALLLAEAARGPSLVAAPTSVCHNWALEAARFAPGLRVRRLSATSDRATAIAELGPGDVLVASYGLLVTEADRLTERRFAVAVFDEAQNLKNAETARAKAAKRIQADFRLALSGTPVENRLDELWNLFDTVTPGLLGSRKSFQRRFAGASEAAQSPRARQALKALVRPYILRRTKAAVLQELPSRTEITLEIEPGPEEKAFYEALRRRALETLAGASDAPGQKRIRILAEITRLRRAACNPALIDAATELESAKLGALLDLVDELDANRHRALVFSQFTGHLDLVEAALKAEGVAFLRLDGSTSAKARAERVAAFQAGEAALFLISLKAGGTGLNLTGADYVIHLDPWWNPAVEDQATDRAHRIGQTRPVTVYRLVIKDSIEQMILALHATKRALAADFLDGASSTGELGEDELMALIKG